MPVRPGGPRCTRIKLNGEQCKQPPIRGGTVCRSHGGAARHVKAAAARRLAEQEARNMAAKHGTVVPANANPLDVLADLLNECLAVKSYLGGLARQIEDEQVRYPGRAGEQLRAEWTAYMSMLRDITRLAETMIKLDLGERRQRLAEAEAVLVIGVIRNVLGDLDLTPEQKRVAARSVSDRLREVTDGRDSEDQPEPYANPKRSPAPLTRAR